MHKTRDERFWSKVDKSAEHWLWTGVRNQDGYGRFRDADGLLKSAHRVAWTMLKGPIPEGKELDHVRELCTFRACVRPEHLEPVTHQENCQRGDAGKHQSDKTHCPAGHPYTPANTYVWRGKRSCRMCGAESTRRYRERLINGGPR